MKKWLKSVWGYRYVVLFIVWLLYIINYFDRFAVIVFMPYIQEDLNLSPEQAGFLLSIFFVPYAISQITSGFLSDKFGPKKVMGVAITVFTFMTAITGFIRSYGQFIILRVGLALGEGHHFPPATKAISNWFPSKSRASALSFFSTTYMAGPAIAPIVLTTLSFHLFDGQWRPVFFSLLIIGAIGIFLLWFFIADTPTEMHKKGKVSDKELKYIEEEDSEFDKSVKKGSPKVFLTDNIFYIGVIMCIFQVALSWGIASWLPTILVQQYNLDLTDMGILAAIPYIIGAFSIMLGGWLMDKLKSMKVVALIAYSGCVPVLFLFTKIQAGDTILLVTLLFFAGFFVNLNYGPLLTFFQLRYPKNVAGSAVGVGNGIGQVGAFIAPLISGYLVTVGGDGSYDFNKVFIFFLIIAVLAVFSALLLRETPVKLKNNNSIIENYELN